VQTRPDEVSITTAMNLHGVDASTPATIPNLLNYL
jgi:hypothetical protein